MEKSRVRTTIIISNDPGSVKLTVGDGSIGGALDAVFSNTKSQPPTRKTTANTMSSA
jgi:hypothetical protein